MLRRILQEPDSTSIESLYLVLWLVPVHIVLRRVNYLHYLTQLNSNVMLYKTFITQWEHPTKGDWTEEVETNLHQIEIGLDLDNIKNQSKNKILLSKTTIGLNTG